MGQPIGAFYGFINDGMFQSAAEINALNQTARQRTGDATAVYQSGALPGRLRFRDVNGDGTVTLADRTIIGSPHPDFTAGLDLQFRRGSFDVSSTLFGTFGNDIFDAQKEFYVFRNFSTNVRKDRLSNSWTPDNPNAKYPEPDVDDNSTRAISSFYVEDGSYVRLRNVQVGYTPPPNLLRGLSNARLYLQGENLLTFTGYDGLDPALPAAFVERGGADVRDQYRGVDRGVYPSSRVFSLGVTTSF